MVFLIQRAQNKDALAIHLKLNEIVAAMEGASNRLIDVEDLSEPEIDALRKYYKRLIELARKDDVLTTTHSIEEAATRHGTSTRRKPRINANERGSIGIRVFCWEWCRHPHCRWTHVLWSLFACETTGSR